MNPESPPLKNNHYKLLVIDIDGTLVSREGEISAENLEALSLAGDAGIHISLCTGRSVHSCRRYINQLGLDNHHIFFDGALVSRPDFSQQIYIRTIAGDTVRQMLEYMREHEMNLEIATIDRFFSERETWSTQAKREFFDIDTIIGDMSRLWETETIIRGDLVIADEADEARARAFMEHFTGRLQFSSAYTPRFPGVSFINATAPGLSKGKSLAALAAYLDIPLAETIAVGDWLNDISLLETAGLGIAMGNAHEELKKVADHVTASVDEHGLAAAIREFLV